MPRITLKIVRNSTTSILECEVPPSPPHGDQLPRGLGVLLIPDPMLDPRLAECPICSDMYALRSGVVDAHNPGTVRGLCRDPGTLNVNRAEMEREWGPLTLENPPNGPARVVMFESLEFSHGYRGTGECARCRTVLGELVIEDSLFGHEEDDRMLLHGRARVY